jgi:hypothetical protein
VTVIPINGNFIPSRLNYRAKIAHRGSPANAIADFKMSGLIASHLNFTSCFRNKLPSPQLFRLVRVQSLLAAKLWNYFAVFLSVTGVNRGYGPAGDVPIPCGDRCEKWLHSVIRTSVVLDVMLVSQPSPLPIH